MKYQRMPIEIEAPEEKGYATIQYNLAESSVRDKTIKETGISLDDLVLFYGEHWGTTPLREAIIKGEEKLSFQNVLVCPSAASALFMVHTSLLDADSHLIVIRPNYGTNLETPRAIGCAMTIIDTSFADNFQIDVQEICEAIKPTTKLISITTPQNPTGVDIPLSTIQVLVEICEKYNVLLLVDETYRDLNFQSAQNAYMASLSPNVLSVCSLSKAFGAPGIRIGWVISQDISILYKLLAAKEQIIISNSVVDEAIALHLLQNKEHILETMHTHIRTNYSIFKEWIASNPYLEVVLPNAGVVAFPRLKKGIEIDTQKFYDTLYTKYATVVGPGHWFEKEKTYMRIGFGYPTSAELTQGLQNITKCIDECLVSK